MYDIMNFNDFISQEMILEDTYRNAPPSLKSGKMKDFEEMLRRLDSDYKMIVFTDINNYKKIYNEELKATIKVKDKNSTDDVDKFYYATESNIMEFGTDTTYGHIYPPVILSIKFKEFDTPFVFIDPRYTKKSNMFKGVEDVFVYSTVENKDELRNMVTSGVNISRIMKKAIKNATDKAKEKTNEYLDNISSKATHLEDTLPPLLDKFITNSKDILNQIIKNNLFKYTETQESLENSIKKVENLKNIENTLSTENCDDFSNLPQKVIDTLKTKRYFTDQTALSAFDKPIEELEKIIEDIKKNVEEFKTSANGKVQTFLSRRNIQKHLEDPEENKKDEKKDEESIIGSFLNVVFAGTIVDGVKNQLSKDLKPLSLLSKKTLKYAGIAKKYFPRFSHLKFSIDYEKTYIGYIYTYPNPNLFKPVNNTVADINKPIISIKSNNMQSSGKAPLSNLMDGASDVVSKIEWYKTVEKPNGTVEKSIKDYFKPAPFITKILNKSDGVISSSSKLGEETIILMCSAHQKF